MTQQQLYKIIETIVLALLTCCAVALGMTSRVRQSVATADDLVVIKATDASALPKNTVLRHDIFGGPERTPHSSIALWGPRKNQQLKKLTTNE